MSTLPPCPKCNSEYTYEDGTQLVCPECAHEWSASGEAEAPSDDTVKKDSVGNVLQD
ncbi:MAG: alkylphosphonate utilization protein, partial [Pseudomonas sp.]